MRTWTLVALSLLALACSESDKDDEDDGSDAAECGQICEEMCVYSEQLTSGGSGDILTEDDCLALCEDAPSAGDLGTEEDCDDCHEWLQWTLWDPYDILMDCFCVTPDATQPEYSEFCEDVIDDNYGGDASTLAAECETTCATP